MDTGKKLSRVLGSYGLEILIIALKSFRTAPDRRGLYSH